MSNQYTLRPELRNFTAIQAAGLRLLYNDGWTITEVSKRTGLRRGQVRALLHERKFYRDAGLQTWTGGVDHRRIRRTQELSEIYASIDRCRIQPHLRVRQWREKLRFVLPASAVLNFKQLGGLYAS